MQTILVNLEVTAKFGDDYGDYREDYGNYGDDCCNYGDEHGAYREHLRACR